MKAFGDDSMNAAEKRKIHKKSGQVRTALIFYTILAALIFFFIGLLIYTFINGGLPGDEKIKDAKDTSVEDSEKD